MYVGANKEIGCLCHWLYIEVERGRQNQMTFWLNSHISVYAHCHVCAVARLQQGVLTNACAL